MTSGDRHAEPREITFQNLARRALEEYDIGEDALTYIRHSDTVTFRVENPDSGTCLLRIHVPITGAMGAHGADSQAVNSELLWLEALNRDTDLVLQNPVRNRSGELVTRIPYEDTASYVNCTLLQWILGQPYHRDLESERTARQIGEILAKMHAHVGSWTIPEGFKRPRRDARYFEDVLSGIRPALEDGRISPADYETYETSIALLIRMLGAQNEDRRIHGIMHADAHKGNMLLHEGGIRLIDFSFCAFGNFMFDLGICFSDMKERLHQSFLEGYTSVRALPHDHERLIEGFFVGSMVGTFSFRVNNPRAQERLSSKVPEIARHHAAIFNRGEHFWFS